MAKNVLILSGSPRKGGNSDALCDQFMKGALEAGNRVEKIRVAEKEVGYCTACYACQKDGRCVKKDDMEGILQKIIDADVIVLSSPVYFYSIDAQLKTIIDRTVARWLEVEGKEFYYIATCADEGRESQETAIACFRGYADCVKGAKEMGIIYGTGAYRMGEIKNTPAFKEAYEMGLTVGRSRSHGGARIRIRRQFWRLRLQHRRNRIHDAAGTMPAPKVPEAGAGHRQPASGQATPADPYCQAFERFT